MTNEHQQQPQHPGDGTSTATAENSDQPIGSSGIGNEIPPATIDENGAKNDSISSTSPAAPTAPTSTSASTSTPQHQTQTPESTQPQPQPHAPSTHSKLPIAPTPPRWRFVNEAKKKSGYSTSDAGHAVDGKSAEELAAKYRPPTIADDRTNGKSGHNGGDVGKLAIPSSFLGQPQQDSLELQQLQKESQRMKLEQERLLKEIELVKEEKERLEEEARLARVEKERVEREALEEKELLAARLAELERKEKEKEKEKEQMEEKEKEKEKDVGVGADDMRSTSTELKSNDDNENDLDEKARLKKKLSELEKNDNATMDQVITTQETTELIVQSLQQKQTDIEAFYASAIERAEQIQRDLDAVVKKGAEQRTYNEQPHYDQQQPLQEKMYEQDLKSTFAEDGSRYPEGDDSVVCDVPTTIETKKGNDNDHGDDDDNKSNRRKYLLWGLLALILIGACIGAAVGVVINQKNSNDKTNSQQALRGAEPTTTTTNAPSTTFDATAPSNHPTLPSSSSNPTILPITTSNPTTATATATATATEETTTSPTTTVYSPITTSPHTTQTPTFPPYNILCRPGLNKNFEINISFDSHPEEISWRLFDACTLQVVEECEVGCYEDMAPYSQRGFQTCVPLWEEETGLEAGYVFVMMDGGGDGLCGDGGGCGSYKVTFGEELVFESDGSFGTEESFFLGVGIENCPEGGVNDTVSTLNPTTAIPNLFSTNPPTSIAPIATPNPSSPPPFSVTCRPGILSKFQLDITFDANPQEVFWVLLDACTLNVIEQCQRCYADQEPNSQITFQTCLPSFNATTGLEAGYVFTIADSSGNGLCDDLICGSYEITYGEEVVYVSADIFLAEQKVFLGSGLDNCLGNSENDTAIVSFNPTTAPPIIPPTNQPTSLASRVTPPPTTIPPSPILCRPGLLTEFQLNITFDANPQEVFWVLLDACTLTVMERCQGCYVNEEPYSQITFQTCLPSFNETTGLEAGYVFTMNDSGGNGLCDNGVCGSYGITYGEEVVHVSDGIFGEEQTVFLGSGTNNCEFGADNESVITSSNPTTAPPIIPPSNPPTYLAPRVTPTPTTLPPSPIQCRPGLLTEFQLNITFDANPQEVFWVLLDACTLTVMERCQGCYVNEEPYSQITFQTCLPSFNETTGLEAGYVFTMNDSGGNGLCDNGVCGSYGITYGEEVVSESDGIYEDQQRVFLGSGLANCPGN